MKKLATANAAFKHFTGEVEVLEWRHGDAFPELGPSVGIDTETELITDTVLAPPVVVLGCFDARNSRCFMVCWQDVPEFMRELCVRDIEQRYFNLGFDEQVIDNETEDKPLLRAIDQNRVYDMQIRMHLNRIQTIGYIMAKDYSLAGCVEQLEDVKLDKGDGTEASARLSFRRCNDDGSDYVITEEQAVYLAYDCISTWTLGEAIPTLPIDPHLGIPFELAHVKGMVALAHISANGFPVDRRIFKALDDKLVADMGEYRKKLLEFGFPDPWGDPKKEIAAVETNFFAQYKRILSYGAQEPSLKAIPAKTNLKLMVMYIYAHEHEPGEVMMLVDDLKCSAEYKDLKFKKKEKELWDYLCEEYELDWIDHLTRPVAFLAFVTHMLETTAEAIAGEWRDYDFREIAQKAADYLNEHPQWCSTEKPIGPKAFFQNHVKGILARNPELKLKQTEKNKDVQLSKTDMWRLQDLHIEDKFLEAYTGYKHAEKLRSTYLNPEFVKDDGRVHAKYSNIVRTGRTACSGPNV